MFEFIHHLEYGYRNLKGLRKPRVLAAINLDKSQVDPHCNHPNSIDIEFLLDTYYAKLIYKLKAHKFFIS
jgi:hypothetical protein